MKAKIHPEYYQATITCVGCGTTFSAGSTVQSIRVDICSKCHPFYTGQKKLIDTEGRVERFEKRIAKRTVARKPQPTVVAATPQAAKAEEKQANRPLSLRDMLQQSANSK